MNPTPAPSPTPTTTTLSSAESVSAALSDSCERAVKKTLELKNDATRSNVVKRSLWRSFAEAEMRELRNSLKQSLLPLGAVQAAQDYLHALDRSQSGTALRGHAWRQRLDRIRAARFTV